MLEDIGVILKEFYPPTMPRIQLLLRVEILKGFMVGRRSDLDRKFDLRSWRMFERERGGGGLEEQGEKNNRVLLNFFFLFCF